MLVLINSGGILKTIFSKNGVFLASSFCVKFGLTKAKSPASSLINGFLENRISKLMAYKLIVISPMFL